MEGSSCATLAPPGWLVGLAAGLVSTAPAAQPLYDWTRGLDPRAGRFPRSLTGRATELPTERPLLVDFGTAPRERRASRVPIPDRQPPWAVGTHFEDRGEGKVLGRRRVADGPLFDSLTLTLLEKSTRRHVPVQGAQRR